MPLVMSKCDSQADEEEVLLKSYTILESLHSSLCSAVTGSDYPLAQSAHVSGSCHGFPNAEVGGQLLAPADRFPVDRLTSDARSCVDTELFSQRFHCIS